MQWNIIGWFTLFMQGSSTEGICQLQRHDLPDGITIGKRIGASA